MLNPLVRGEMSEYKAYAKCVLISVNLYPTMAYLMYIVVTNAQLKVQVILKLFLKMVAAKHAQVVPDQTLSTETVLVATTKTKTTRDVKIASNTD